MGESLLVLRFSEDAFVDHHAVAAFEDSLFKILGRGHEVYGRDTRPGEVSFFVFTTNARTALDEILAGLEDRLSHRLRAAARPAGGEAFQTLWPVGDTRAFTIG